MTTSDNLCSLLKIAEFLDQFFTVCDFPVEEQGGVYIPSSRPIKRLGLALEPWEQLEEWIISENLDGLFLHRPWKLESKLPDIGVISYHLPFDERLCLGFNPRLAQILGMSHPRVLGEKG